MLGRTTGAQLFGVEARLIDVEVDLAGGLPTIAAVGLPDSAVREGIDRIRSALKNAGFRLPPNRVVINLAPADVRKQGASLDLPIAVALLNADEQLPPVKGAVAMVGELALDGSVRAVRGVVSIALAAREAGRRLLLVPPANFEEASLVDGIEVAPVGTLADVAAFGAPGERPAPRRGTDLSRRLNEVAQGTHGPDLREVRGQPSARRALEIAAAGGHHLLLCGAPGSGKTMLARRMPGILPPMSVDESLDATRVWSAAGLSSGPVLARPFRAPHHGVSLAGMTGGGRQLRPGEVSLATHGVLYLDELIEFRRDVLEALRQPIEDGVILVSRVHGSAAFPARFTLVASMNPCP
ncbi:MAG: YifB family Mg chelatase-like AAA ATPase, partial [bacterium]|nr:YifB family Mg chelatase-like AAA ATPase [bacterium]